MADDSVAQAAGQILQSVIAGVRGDEINKAIASLTLDHLLYEQILAIEGGDADYALSLQGQTADQRTPKLKRLQLLLEGVDRLVEMEESAERTPE